MKRPIIGFHRDEVGDPVADLDCAHARVSRALKTASVLFGEEWIEA